MQAMANPVPHARTLILVISLIPLLACGGRSIGKSSAQELIARSPVGPFDREEVYIKSVSLTGQRDALVEAGLNAAFRCEKVDGKWVIREVRLGKRQWEKLEDILRALQIVKTEETGKILEQVAAAVERYKSQKGSLPEFKDYVSLSDKLHPDFMTPLIRLDAWQNPLAARKTGANSIELISPGPDGKLGTADDIRLLRTIP